MTVRELRTALFHLPEQDAPVDLAGLLALATGDSRFPVMLCEILSPIAASYDHDSDEPPAPRVSDAVELMNAFGWI